MTKLHHQAGLALALTLLGGCAGPDLAPELGTQQQPSICGNTTDWQDVESYNGALGPSIAFVDKHERPVGYMPYPGCTGTLIAPDLYLTADHCVSPYTVVGGVIRFNYQNDPDGELRDTTDYTITSVVETGLGGRDYAILRLAGSPGNTWGVTVPSAFYRRGGEAITLIQHPDGIPKVVEGGTSQYDGSGEILYDNLDTIGGASGAGVLQNSTGLVIGVHTHGVTDGVCNVGDPNGGEAMETLVGVSPVLRRLALDPAKLVAVSVL